MPMFEDNQDLGVRDGEQSRQTQRPSTHSSPCPPDRADTPSKPISIPPPPPTKLARKLSEESIRTDLCEGPVLDSPQQQTAWQPSPTSKPPSRDASVSISDRAELIERLKRGESPTWVPHRHLEPLLRHDNSPSPPRPSRPFSSGTPTTALLPAADIALEKETPSRDTEALERLQNGLNIARPHSALHSGDFTHDAAKEHSGREGPAVPSSRDEEETYANSTAWMATSPPRHYNPFFEIQSPPRSSLAELDVFRIGLSVSSLSSSFVYKPPTSPLVQSESNNDDNDNTGMSLPLSSTTPNSEKENLRQPNRYSYTSHYEIPPPPLRRRTASFRRDGIFPYQAHQPRRSLTSTPCTASMPQTPGFPHPRRISFAADTSPLQHASMVGSYEESILRGRMSTTPSKPLDFLAQIGVLGLGAKCKPNLRCPPHVTLPFSAVFYSYASTPHGRSKMEDGPSPYVGMVDLENGLPNQEAEQRCKRKHLQSRTAAARMQQNQVGDAAPAEGTRAPLGEDTTMKDAEADAASAAAPTAVPTATTRGQKRRSHRAPPGGSYRIPAQGQLQIIIKNQNKTAVKLFLIPYDVSDMEPETKTFIRQRCYSAGPIIDNVPALTKLSLSERPILRYLVHLHICSPSRGRYYLYNSIRVVFANRVPDGKEKLRNELSFPEPRYSPYKPIRVLHPPMGSGGSGAILAAEKAYRRRSSGLSFGPRSADHKSGPSPLPSLPIPVPKAMASWRPSQQQQQKQMCGSPSFSFASSIPVEAVPFGLDRSRMALTSSPITDHPSSSPTRGADSNDKRQQEAASALVPLTYNKLSKGDVGYGGNAFASMAGGTAAAEGLLSQRLRLLGVQRSQSADEQDAGES